MHSPSPIGILGGQRAARELANIHNQDQQVEHQPGDNGVKFLFDMHNASANRKDILITHQQGPGKRGYDRPDEHMTAEIGRHLKSRMQQVLLAGQSKAPSYKGGRQEGAGDEQGRAAGPDGEIISSYIRFDLVRIGISVANHDRQRQIQQGEQEKNERIEYQIKAVVMQIPANWNLPPELDRV